VFSNCTRRGTGRKLGEGVQFTTTVIGGFIYAFYASWRVSLVILTAVPLMVGSATFLMAATTKQTERKSQDYAETGGIVYSTISAIRTVFSLNASETMIEQFNAATKKSYDNSVSFGLLIGFGNGIMMASFLVSYIILTLYGSFLLYNEVGNSGCDPSNTLGALNQACGTTGTEVFGALMGISFGAMGLAQIANALEAFVGARAACYPALETINRTVAGHTAEVIDEEAAVAYSGLNAMPLPRYVIDSSSDLGKIPNSIHGAIEFKDVSFAYPTRPNTMVFNGMSLKIEAGKTVALVGPSGGGKSTTVAMLERFYDPTSGSVTLDGVDIRDLKVQWLRDHIGLVAQEPVLFARTIKENIAYGMKGATDEDIIRVAKDANAHDFISQFPNGYETQVGDKGAQLSGGQKQRIAIARVLMKNPKILILDEATSALDSESEYVVQEALDKLLDGGNRTTIVIAHRLSTIRNADMIAVVKDGKIVETGTHDELLARTGSEYSKLVEAQVNKKSESSTDLSKALPASNNEVASITGNSQITFRDVHFHYPSRPNVKIFKGLNLSIQMGETLAIVGPSGGGKSTIVQMIERFYDPIDGQIMYEGNDLKDLNIKWYRDQIGFVSQEPTLFNTTIGANIKYGYPDATQEDIEDAARQANAHDFIMGFPNGYSTDVGENATQISGGQKQRIAIARAIIKKPKILILDEATSALDTESERVVQEAIDRLMMSKGQTIIVIAHRLSTIVGADRIAVIADGILKEIGGHTELMTKANGRYKRLVEFQSMTGTEKKTTMKDLDEEEEDKLIDTTEHFIAETDEEKEKEKVQSNRARLMAKDDLGLFFVGSIGAILAGLVFPCWGIVFAFTIELLFRPVYNCDDGIDGTITIGTEISTFETCEDYWGEESDAIRDLSYNVVYGWLGLVASTLIGNVLLFYGFGTAMERMNKRVRDAVFSALMRQDIQYYDKHSVAKLSSQIEDDAAMIHSFSGEPIRTLIMSLASVLVGLIISFAMMWPFAALSMLILPFLGFGAYMEMKMYMGEDAGAEAPKEGQDSAGAIVIETLLSIRTVSSLTIERLRAAEYEAALKCEDPDAVKTNLLKGAATGVGFLSQLWGIGFMFWWGKNLIYFQFVIQYIIHSTNFMFV
jgi:ATP-binding cassette subfamily B (MDR/TAP) protein 1